MPVNNETLNKNLYDALRALGHDPISLNSKGDPTSDVEKADVFRFSVKSDGEKVSGWVTIEGPELVLYTDDKFNKMEGFEQFTEYMKTWSQRKLLGFNITNKDHLRYDMQKRTNMKNKENLGEGYYPINKKSSFNDSVPEVKILIQHSRALEEGEQRYRNVDKIYLENANNERFLLPTKKPGIAKVYARHIAEGGLPYDDKWRHIHSLVEDYTKMAGFVRATRNGTFVEQAVKLVNEGLKHYNDLRMTLKGLTSHRGYNKYFESYTPVLNEETTETTNLNELFVQENLDPRIENVLPILSRLNKNITEVAQVSELASWADEVINETLLGEETKEKVTQEGIMDKLQGVAKTARKWGLLPQKSKPTQKPLSSDQQAELQRQSEAEKNKARTSAQETEYANKAQKLKQDYDNASRRAIRPEKETLRQYDGQGRQEYTTRGTGNMETDYQDRNLLSVYERMYDFVNEILEIKKQNKYFKEPPYFTEFIRLLNDNQGRKMGNILKKGLGDKPYWDHSRQPTNEEYKYDEVKPAKYEVVDQSNRRVGTWDGVKFRPYDKSKYKGQSSMDMIPAGCKVDKASGPVTDSGIGLGKMGLEEYAKPEKKDPSKMGPPPTPKPEKKNPSKMSPPPTPKPKKKDPKDAMFKEGLSKQQKRVGQLGPTEKVKKNSGARGKLVGANESVELARLKNLSGIK